MSHSPSHRPLGDRDQTDDYSAPPPGDRVDMPDGLRASSVLEVAWDLIPDMAGTNLLPELVGRDEVKELTFTGRIVCGDEAVRIRLVTGTDPGLLAAALALAKEIAGRSPHAVRAAKGPSSSSPTSATSNSDRLSLRALAASAADDTAMVTARRTVWSMPTTMRDACAAPDPPAALVLPAHPAAKPGRCLWC